MDQEVLAVALILPYPGLEEETLVVLRELYAMLGRKGYSRDLLYRDDTHHSRLVHLRYWRSEQARRDAMEDPDAHRFWVRLPSLCEVNVVSDTLVDVTKSV